MQVVIEIHDIPKNDHERWVLTHGTPLPKHHRLIEADRLKEELDYYIREAGWSDDHNEALTWCKEFIDHAETIIPATKEGDSK